AEAIAQGLQFLMQTWGPSLMNPGGYSFQKFQRALSGDYVGDPNQPTTGEAFMGDVLPFRARPFDPATSYGRAAIAMKAQLDDALADVRRQSRRPNLTLEQMAALRADPDSALGRSIARARRIVQDFRTKYPQRPPPSPEKLLKAMRRKVPGAAP